MNASRMWRSVMSKTLPAIRNGQHQSKVQFKGKQHINMVRFFIATSQEMGTRFYIRHSLNKRQILIRLYISCLFLRDFEATQVLNNRNNMKFTDLVANVSFEPPHTKCYHHPIKKSECDERQDAMQEEPR